MRDGTWNVFRRAIIPWINLRNREQFRVVYFDIATLDVESTLLNVLEGVVRDGEPVVICVGTHGNATSIFAHGRAYPRATLEAAFETLVHRRRLTLHVLWQCCQGTIASHISLVEDRGISESPSIELNTGLRERGPVQAWLSQGMRRFKNAVDEGPKSPWSECHEKKRTYHWFFAPVGFLLKRHGETEDLELDSANFLYFILGLRIFSRPKIAILRKVFRYVQQRWNYGHGAIKISY